MAKNKSFGILLVLLLSFIVLTGCPKDEVDNELERSSNDKVIRPVPEPVNKV